MTVTVARLLMTQDFRIVLGFHKSLEWLQMIFAQLSRWNRKVMVEVGIFEGLQPQEAR
jgi:hypothetical protein